MKACASRVPGIGGISTGSSAKNNYEALRSLRFKMKTLHDVTEPDINVELFWAKVSHARDRGSRRRSCDQLQDRMNEADLAKAQVFGALEAGTIAMIGDSPGDLYDKTIEALKRSR